MAATGFDWEGTFGQFASTQVQEARERGVALDTIAQEIIDNWGQMFPGETPPNGTYERMVAHLEATAAEMES